MMLSHSFINPSEQVFWESELYAQSESDRLLNHVDQCTASPERSSEDVPYSAMRGQTGHVGVGANVKAPMILLPYLITQ